MTADEARAIYRSLVDAMDKHRKESLAHRFNIDERLRQQKLSSLALSASHAVAYYITVLDRGEQS